MNIFASICRALAALSPLRSIVVDFFSTRSPDEPDLEGDDIWDKQECENAFLPLSSR